MTTAVARRNQPMQVEIHRSIDSLAPEWDALADRVGAPPWLRPGWMAAWWKAFGRGKLEIVTLRGDGELAALAPLRRHTGGIRSASNWHSPGYGFLVEDGAGHELAAAIFGPRPRSVSVKFVEPADAAFQECLSAARRAGYLLLERTLERSPYLELSGSWADFEAGISAKLRRDLRRRERRLAEAGEVAFEVTDGAEKLDELFAEGARVEAAGWKGKRGTAIASNATTRGFYEDVARWAAARGTLRFAFLRAGGRAIAFDFCFEENGVHYLLKTGYEEEFARYAPGKLLRLHMLRRAYEHGLRRYDFLGDDADWKSELAGALSDRLELHAFRPDLAGRLEWAAFTHGRPLVLRLLRRGA
jgi:CelD/BcsL family acetyltransferase involved in cellulose biosynthesis